jgi:N-acylglucosamine 2-epimerase
MDLKTLQSLKTTYESLLYDSIIPYWEKHGMDREYGGFMNCMRDNGELISEDKYMWSQGRGLWTFSYLYNNFMKNNKVFYFIYKTHNFLLKNAYNRNYDWFYRLSRTGEKLDGPLSIYSDMFSTYGLVEYYRADGDKKSLETARKTAHRIAWRLAQKDFTATAPLKIKPGTRLQGTLFISLNMLTPLLTEINDPELEKEAERCADLIVNHHMDETRKLNIEVLNWDFTIPDDPQGRDYVPGHGIECAWILMVEAQRKKDKKLMDSALKILRWHIEKGWDNEYGGIYWWHNIDGDTPYEKNWQFKLWWPHVESLLAFMLAYEITEDKYYWDWFMKIHDYSFRTFTDHENGEWKQRLDREGNLITQTLVLPVKDPFHLPRAVMFVIESLGRIIEKKKTVLESLV